MPILESRLDTSCQDEETTTGHIKQVIAFICTQPKDFHCSLKAKRKGLHSLQDFVDISASGHGILYDKVLVLNA